LMLLSLGIKDSLRFSMLQEDMEKIIVLQNNYHVKCLHDLKLIFQARQYLKANVNPRLVLEQIIINI